MRKTILLLVLITAILSCKNQEEKTPSSQEQTIENAGNFKIYEGDFINSDGAMVLMGPDYIYGVKRDGLSERLSQQVATVKMNEFDMVGVRVRGMVSKNTDPQSEWEEEITIKEIMKVNDTPSEVDIKLSETTKNK